MKLLREERMYHNVGVLALQFCTDVFRNCVAAALLPWSALYEVKTHILQSLQHFQGQGHKDHLWQNHTVESGSKVMFPLQQ